MFLAMHFIAGTMMCSLCALFGAIHPLNGETFPGIRRLVEPNQGDNKFRSSVSFAAWFSMISMYSNDLLRQVDFRWLGESASATRCRHMLWCTGMFVLRAGPREPVAHNVKDESTVQLPLLIFPFFNTLLRRRPHFPSRWGLVTPGSIDHAPCSI